MKRESDNTDIGISRTRLARETGIGVETIRYYERIGLIEAPRRQQHAHPLHPPSISRHLLFIKRAQDAGFTLKEIARLLELGTEHCSQTRVLASSKLETIRLEIAALQLTADRLVTLIAACGDEGDGDCPLYELLADEDCPGCRE